MKIPALYKFSPPNQYGLDSLRNRTLCCRHYSAFNDPFEFWTRHNIKNGVPDREKEPERFLDAIEAWGVSEEDAVNNDYNEFFNSLVGLQPLFEALYDTSRLTCFGTEPDNMLLWSHYADGLRGFCLRFDTNKLVSDPGRHYLTAVNYTEEVPVLDEFVYAVLEDQKDYHLMAIDEEESWLELECNRSRKFTEQYRQVLDDTLLKMHEVWTNAFASKPTHWSYENEARLIIHGVPKEQEAFYHKFSPDTLTEVIIGEKISPSYESDLVELVNSIYGNVRFRKAVRSKDNYKLVIL